LRPEAAGGCIEIEKAPFDEAERDKRGEGLADGEEVDERIARPWRLPRGVAPAAPEIADEPAADHERDGGARLAALLEILHEGFAERREARIAGAVYRHGAHATSSAMRLSAMRA